MCAIGNWDAVCDEGQNISSSAHKVWTLSASKECSYIPPSPMTSWENILEVILGVGSPPLDAPRRRFAALHWLPLFLPNVPGCENFARSTLKYNCAPPAPRWNTSSPQQAEEREQPEMRSEHQV